MKNIKETVSDYIQNVRQSLSTLEVPDKEKQPEPPDSWLKQVANGQTPEENAITKKYNDYVVELQDILAITKTSEDPNIKSIPIQTRKQIFNDIVELFKKQNKEEA